MWVLTEAFKSLSSKKSKKSSNNSNDKLDSTKIGKCTWPDQLSIELYLEISNWITVLDYWRFLITSKSKFDEIRYATRKIILREEDGRKFLFDSHYRDMILFKIKNPYYQLKLTKIYNNFDFTNNLLVNCSMKIQANNLHLYPTWQETISNHQQIILSDNSHIRGIGGLSNIIHLQLFNFTQLTEVHRFYNIHELEFHGCPMLNDLSSLSKCIGLKKIILSNCKRILSLNGLENVEIIKIYSCERLQEITALANSTRLRHVTIKNSPLVMNIQSLLLSSIPSIETDLIHSWDQSSQQHSSIRNLILCESKIYNLSHFHLNPSHHHNHSYGQLYSIHLFHCHSLQNVNGLFSIHSIHLDNCSNLVDISDLGGNNYSVIIQECPLIINFSSLKYIPYVTINYCHGFKNGYDVDHVKILKILNCSFFRDVRMLQKCSYLKLSSHKIDYLKGLYHIPIVELIFNVNLPSCRGLGGNKRITMNDKLYRKLWNDYEKDSSIFPMDQFDVFLDEENLRFTLLRK